MANKNIPQVINKGKNLRTALPFFSIKKYKAKNKGNDITGTISILAAPRHSKSMQEVTL